jgi:hypothetical protein
MKVIASCRNITHIVGMRQFIQQSSDRFDLGHAV